MNSVLMSLCTYWMQIMIIPKAVIKKINNLCRRFLWEGHLKGSKSGYVNWTKVCTSKKMGGLGIRDVSLWNDLVVGKIIWQIAEKKDSLWVRWVHAVYLKEKDW